MYHVPTEVDIYCMYVLGKQTTIFCLLDLLPTHTEGDSSSGDLANIFINTFKLLTSLFGSADAIARLKAKPSLIRKFLQCLCQISDPKIRFELKGL